MKFNRLSRWADQHQIIFRHCQECPVVLVGETHEEVLGYFNTHMKEDHDGT